MQYVKRARTAVAQTVRLAETAARAFQETDRQLEDGQHTQTCIPPTTRQLISGVDRFCTLTPSPRSSGVDRHLSLVELQIKYCILRNFSVKWRYALVSFARMTDVQRIQRAQVLMRVSYG